MGHQPIKVLVIEGEREDAAQVRDRLAKATSPACTVECVDRLHAGLTRLAMGGIDVVLLALSLPDRQGLEAFTVVHAQAPTVPIVVLADRTTESQALEAVRNGAQDYLLKHDTDDRILPRVIRYAIERKRAAEALQDSKERLKAENKRLEESAALKDEFVAKVSHELRTPLTAIKEGINLMLDGALGGLNAEQRDFLGTVDENIDRLTELISNMLDISKIEAGRLHLLRRRLAIRPLIETTLTSYKAMAGHRLVKADVAAVSDVFADPGRVLQVLGNLFSNAVKFTKDDGTIAVALHERDDCVAVSVQDDGIGIAQDEIPKLFQKFSQVGRGDSKRQGSGLGLALCKELVELQRGGISVTSRPGHGSTFTFTLPVYSAQFALEESFRELVELAKETEEEVVGLIVLDGEPLLAHLSDMLSVPLPAQMTKGQAGVRHTDRSGDRHGGLELLAELVRKALHRGDVVLSIEPQWVVILIVADAAGVQAVVQRLRRALHERLAESGSTAEGIPIHFGAAVYPADGTDVHVLFAKATQSLNRGLTALEHTTKTA